MDWRHRDLDQIAALGMSVAEVERQLELFRHPPRPLELLRPCAVGEGIRVLSEAEVAAAPEITAAARRAGRMTKFVPASGAATRMFQALLAAREGKASASRADALRLAEGGDATARALLEFAEGLPRFAFRDDLRAALAREGRDLDGLAASGDLAPVLDALLLPGGLDYAALPKGLLAFHRYPDGARTPFEEHLFEAAGYVRAADGACRVHFTVSPEHQERFGDLLERVRAREERRLEARFAVDFSTQKASTDTIAVGLDDEPFRRDDGGLLFRPGGHGALIENLQDLRADIVFIKNIDNVVPEHLAGLTIEWKQALASVLLRLEEQIFRHLALLAGRPSTAEIESAARFAREELWLPVPEGGDAARTFLLEKLDRPLRVCGAVPNTGEPGGGPFWVRDANGAASLQIVESAQIDSRSEEQRRIFAASSHFNPVDLVCGLRNQHGELFDLRRHTDPSAVFIARKSSGGRDLKALERPGLWNGAMADWTTVFVEVPLRTFNPVKTVLDLLRVEHQPG